MISDSCASVGNVVQSRENAPIWELFYEALEKIELVVGINGEVEMPQIHVGEKAFEDLKNSIANAPPDFTQKLDELKAKKRDEAYAREAARRAKFARYGDEE
ncbi:hypothetical protein [Dyella sp. C11]|uniref:hypothetical protein n=1 Tax=Dyella sp. C11 TaxID=2126991 RepID=UPI001E43E75B|nr:hypothetical protein [Dyella sp. C11]